MDAKEFSGNVVLVIDDDEINLLLAKTILEKKLPCKVIAINNGIEGLDILERQPINVLLLDIDMPDMDGFETLERIRQRESLRDLPVIMLTAAADKETVIKVAKQGVEGYVKKPFLPDELIARVEKFILPRSANTRVLIVDDEEDKLDHARKVIDEAFPYEIVTAESGLEALGMMLKDPAPLMLIDAGMEFMDGFQTAEFLSDNDQLKDVKIILMTETEEEAASAENFRSPIYAGYIRKPLALENWPPELYDLLKHLGTVRK